MSDTFQFHNLHSPDEVRVFTVPTQALRRWDEEALVYDVQVESGLVLRHYALFSYWFEVNCTLGLDGSFVTEPWPIDWCFNCDVCTPFFAIGTDGYNVDLELDVLVAPDGRQHAVIDEDTFADAVQRGWITRAEQEGARRGLAGLIDLVETGKFLDFLGQTCPFDREIVSMAPPAGPRLRRSLADVPPLDPRLRGRYFGRQFPAESR
ncbi:MAG TPA: hypothetical protein VNL16_13515 [Chloroflexota bacterium]|nr:hypothetical protein [Chloroflexota bacterium]